MKNEILLTSVYYAVSALIVALACGNEASCLAETTPAQQQK